MNDTIAIYCRVSTSKQLDGYSIPIQVERGTAFAHKKQFTPKVFIEAGSGADSTRIEFNKMLDEIRDKRINKVWVINRDRLQRSDLDEVVQLRNFFETHEVEVWINDEVQKLDSPEALLADNMKAVLAKYVRDNIRRHVKNARTKAREEGRLHATKMYGYDRGVNPETGKTKWLVNEKEAIGLKYMFEQYNAGVSLGKIAIGLNNLGIKPKMSDVWNAVKVAKIMSNPEYFGLTENNAGELIQSKIYPAIFDKSEYIAFGKDKQKREKTLRVFRYSDKLLTGLIRCGICGSPFYLRAPTGNYTHINYADKCNLRPKNIPIRILEPLFMMSYLLVFYDKSEIQSFIEARNKEVFEGIDNESRLIEITRKEIDAMKVKAGSIIDKMMNVSFGAVADKLDSALKKLSEEIATKEHFVNSKILEQNTKHDDLEELIDTLSDEAMQNFRTANPIERRATLRDVVESAIMDGNQKLTITMKNTKKYVAHIPHFRGRRPDRDNEVISLVVDMYYGDDFQVTFTMDCIEFSIANITYNPTDTFVDMQRNKMVKQLPKFVQSNSDGFKLTFTD